MTAMTELRDKSRHHHRIFTEKSDDIASLLALPSIDAHKLWNLTAHSKEAMIKEVKYILWHIFFGHVSPFREYCGYILIHYTHYTKI